MKSKSKGGYRTYQFYTDSILRLNRNTLNIPKKQLKKKDSIYKVIQDQIAKNPDFINSMTFLVLAEEHDWLQYSDKPIIFPKDPALLEMIGRAKIDSKGLQLEPLWDSYLLSFPKDYLIAGQKIDGCMITHQTFSARGDMINRLLTGSGHDPVQTYDPNIGITGRDEVIFTLTYPALFDTPGSSHQQKGLSRVVMSQSQMNHILSSESAEDYGARLGNLPTRDQREFALTSEDKELQFEIMKIVTKLLVYVQALGDEVLREGYPSNTRPNIEGGVIEGRAKDFTISSITSKSSNISVSDKEVHYRAWHFRTLTHDKFYKTDDWKDRPRGSRVVFIKDTMVGEKIDPYTLE